MKHFIFYMFLIEGDFEPALNYMNLKFIYLYIKYGEQFLTYAKEYFNLSAMQIKNEFEIDNNDFCEALNIEQPFDVRNEENLILTKSFFLSNNSEEIADIIYTRFLRGEFMDKTLNLDEVSKEDVEEYIERKYGNVGGPEYDEAELILDNDWYKEFNDTFIDIYVNFHSEGNGDYSLVFGLDEYLDLGTFEPEVMDISERLMNEMIQPTITDKVDARFFDIYFLPSSWYIPKILEGFKFIEHPEIKEKLESFETALGEYYNTQFEVEQHFNN